MFWVGIERKENSSALRQLASFAGIILKWKTWIYTFISKDSNKSMHRIIRDWAGRGLKNHLAPASQTANRS